VRAALLAVFLLPAAPALAQEPACPAGAISEVFIDNGSVFDVGSEPDARFAWAYRAANKLHVRTRRAVIRRELLFRVGDCYLEERLEDTRRILRALPFIADADVYAVAQPDGSQHVVVETRDDWSFRIEPQWDSSEGWGLVGVGLREDNLLGTGQHLSGYVKRHQGARVYGAAVGTQQLLGTRLHGDLAVDRTPVGVSVSQRLAYPFRGEAGRWAFRQQVERLERNFEYYVPSADRSRAERRYFEEERRSFDAGALFRLGRRGNLTLLGAGVEGEWTVYPRAYLSGDGAGRIPALLDGEEAPPAEVTGLDTVSAVRFVLLAGQRNVAFVRRRALDAVRGSEDVRLGVEVEGALGRSLGGLSRDDDLHASAGLSAAGELGRLLWGVRLTAEGRRDLRAAAGSAEWSNLFGQADAWGYWRPHEESRHTVVAAVAGVGGWRTTVPFQLTLGNRSGLRGFPAHAFPGQRRVVGSVEHRMYLGWPYPRLFDLGSVVFVDAGKMWVGGDDFGLSSPVEASAGLGLRLAFPPGTRRTYRLDVAAPLTRRGGLGDVVVTVGVNQAIGRDPGEDPQLRRSSRRPLSASLFRFPR
jgi:hypothetical protein